MADLETLMYGNMVHSAREVENLRRQRDYYNRIQNQGAFDQYGGYPQYGGGYGGGRGSYASAQRLMMSHDLTVQRMLLEQQINQQKVADEAAATKQERERKLAVIDQEIEEMKNAELDKNSPWYKDQMRLLEARRTEALTDLNVYVPQEHKVDSGLTRTVIDPATGAKKEEPIMSAYFVNEKGDLVWTRNGKDIHAANLAEDSHKAEKLNKTGRLNLDMEKHELEIKKEERMNRETAIKESAERREASGKKEADDIYKEKISIRDKMMTERGAERKEWLSRKMDAWNISNPKADLNEKAAMKEQFTRESYDKFPSNVKAKDVNERYENRQLLRKPTLSTDEEKKSVQYEQPEDAMYPEEDPLGMGASDEQFAGTEPAGLYDPTGQPLQMEGGMYSGFA
jgi:hypothetical protein